MNNTYYGKLIFELSQEGRCGYTLPDNELSEYSLESMPAHLLRGCAPALPQVDELTVVRHYTNMSNNNFGVDTGFYPLGSCTMKYNPKINEEIASHRDFTGLHPWQPVDSVQGALAVYYTLQECLSEIAGMMMTNPNTLGIFEQRIGQIASLVHECGGLMYYDGANLNPLLGRCRPGDLGFDIMHINLHKTFSTPHGGGGPGSGPVGVRAGLEQFLPNPRVTMDEAGNYDILFTDESLGSISGFLGNFGVIMRALAYILTLGNEHLKMVGPLATLNANYVKESLKDCYELPIEGICKHEFVFDGLKDKSTGVTTLDVAKRLLDNGFHAPTIYFPLLFHQALMIEPTENESRETLDAFIDVMRRIAQEAATHPQVVKEAPHHTPVRRLDDTQAALHPIVTFKELAQ